MNQESPPSFTLITGASSGIGRQTACRLSADHRLVLVGRNQDELNQTKSLCVQPEHHHTLQLDLSRPEQVAEQLTSFMKTESITVDGFVHSAGTLTVQPLRTTSLATGQTMMNVNFFSAVEISKVLISQRINGQALRSIVFVSSIASQYGAKGHALYCASKGALDALMRSLAVELAPRVRVNSVLPGAIKTAMTADIFANEEVSDRLAKQYPLGVGVPDDIASAIEFLLSDQARWITGQQFVVDGGRTADITA